MTALEECRRELAALKPAEREPQPGPQPGPGPQPEPLKEGSLEEAEVTAAVDGMIAEVERAHIGGDLEKIGGPDPEPKPKPEPEPKPEPRLDSERGMETV